LVSLYLETDGAPVLQSHDSQRLQARSLKKSVMAAEFVTIFSFLQGKKDENLL